MKGKPFLNVIFTKSYFSRSISQASFIRYPHLHFKHHPHVKTIKADTLAFESAQSSAQIIFIRQFSSREESYFSAIGGKNDDPMPELTPQRVSKILSANEKTIRCKGPINTIDCNQLPSNDPTEDRVRVSKLVFNDTSSSLMLFGVFDGHGGRFCADVVTRRLFKYITLTLSDDPVGDVAQKRLDNIVQDMYICPDIDASINLTYGANGDKLSEYIAHQDQIALHRYAELLVQNCPKTFEDKLYHAFVTCDQDLSDEIEAALSSTKSKILLHYYYSLAVSGCCVSLILVKDDDCFIASTGDCKAVLGFREASGSQRPITKSIDLNFEHNSDNVAEIKRLVAAHPLEDVRNLVKNDRLLSHLMPFRSFGDFCYKWETEKIKRVGLTRAFGSHIIPPHYRTPPYLIADPEISKFSLSYKTKNTVGSRFIVMATDGLWEQFQSSRCVVKQLFRHDNIYNSIKNFNLSKEEDQGKVCSSILSGRTQESINDENDALNSTETSRLIVDSNRSTYLLRAALGTDQSADGNLYDPLERFNDQHTRLVTFLTLPKHLVRNFRDDISLIVLHLN